MCTQCSGSHGLAASEAPWGQDLPHHTYTLHSWTPPSNPAASATSAPWGSGQQRGQQAAPRTMRPGSLCQCLRTSSLFSGDLWGPACCSPFLFLSLYCHVYLLPNWAPWPFPVLLGGGEGFLLLHALGPQPENGGHKVPSIEPSPPTLVFPEPDRASGGLEQSPGCWWGKNQPPHLLPRDWDSFHLHCLEIVGRREKICYHL